MKVFIKVFITSSLVFALPRVFSFVFGGEWLTVLLADLLMGTIFGFLLAMQAFIITRYFGYSGCSLVITLSVLGFITSVILFKVGDDLPTGEWERLPSAPEKPVKFGPSELFNQTENIYVYTDKGNLYTYECGPDQPCDWKIADPTVDPTKHKYDGCRIHYRAPRYPARVIDSQVNKICAADGVVQVNFLITEDGTVWKWSKVYMGLVMVFYLFVGAAGFIAGLVSGVVLLLQIPHKKVNSTTAPDSALQPPMF